MSYLDGLFEGTEAESLGTTGAPVNVGQAAAPAGAGRVLVTDDATHATWKLASALPVGAAASVQTTGAAVNFAAAAPPLAGQVPTAVSPTQIAWKNPRPLNVWPTVLDGDTQLEANYLYRVDGTSQTLTVPDPDTCLLGDRVAIRITSIGVSITLDTPNEETRIEGVDILGSSTVIYAEYVLDTAGDTAYWRQVSVVRRGDINNVQRVLRVADFIPLGEQPNNDNYEGALNAAIAAAYASPLPGMRVEQLPGRYLMSAAVVLPATVFGQRVELVGAGMGVTMLEFPPGLTGHWLSVNPNGEAGEAFNGYVADFSMDDGGAYASTAKGLYIRETLVSLFERISVDGPAGVNGYACFITDENGASNNQDTTVRDCVFSNCYNGAYVRSFTQGLLENCKYNNCINAKVILAGGYNQFEIAGGLFQGGGTLDPLAPQPPMIQTLSPNNGNNVVTFSGQFYVEGVTTKLLAQTTPVGEGSGADLFRLDGLQINGQTQVGIDVEVCDILIINMRGATEFSNPRLKARNTTSITWIGGPNIHEHPSLFDLDETSRGNMVLTYPGGVFRGQASDALSAVSLVRPFAVELWDPNVVAAQTFVNGRATAVKGLINGSVATEIAASQGPVWNKFDPNFGGRASWSCTAAANSGLQATLAVGVAVGEYGGIGACMRATGAATGGVRRGPVLFNGTYGSQTHLFWLAINDLETGGDFCAGGAIVPGKANYNVSTQTAGQVAHLLLSQATIGVTTNAEVGDTTLYTDSSAAGENYGSDTANPCTVLVNKVLIPACSPGVSSNIDFGLIWIQNRRLPFGLIQQLYDIGCQLFGVASIATPSSPVPVTQPKIAPVIFDTAGTTVYVVPTGYKAKRAWIAGGSGGGGSGGGGGGGASAATGAGGGGGGGGAGGSCVLNEIPLDIAAGTSLDIVVGAAGVGNVSPGSGNAAGGATATVTTAGGAGGDGGASSISITGGALQVSAIGGLGGAGATAAAAGSGGVAGSGGARGAGTYGNNVGTGGSSGVGATGGTSAGASSAPALPAAKFGLALATYATVPTGAAAGTTDVTRQGGGAGGAGGMSAPGWGVAVTGHVLPGLTGAGSGAAMNAVAGGAGNNTSTGSNGTAATTNTGTGTAGRGGAGGGGGGGGGAGLVTGGLGAAGAAGANGGPGIIILEVEPT